MISVKEDLTGKVFNRLTVLEQVDDHITKSGDRRAYWKCICECGNITFSTGKLLKNGDKQSCGCLMKEKASEHCKTFAKPMRNESSLQINLIDEHGLYGKCLLNNKEFMYFDMDDYDLIKNYCWKTHYHKDGYKVVQAKVNGAIIHLHKLIGFKNCDHIDHNTLNNRKYNLRQATPSQNAMNASLRKNNKSGIKGVYWDTRESRWIAKIGYNHAHVRIGAYTNKEDAVIARLKIEYILFGEYSSQQELFIKYDIVNKIETDKEWIEKQIRRIKAKSVLC